MLAEEAEANGWDIDMVNGNKELGQHKYKDSDFKACCHVTWSRDMSTFKVGKVLVV